MTKSYKIATWNFGYGSPTSPSKKNKAVVRKALEYLKEEGVDIILAQEVPNPEEFKDIYSNQIYSRVPINLPSGEGKWGDMDYSKDTNNIETSQWGTAVLARDGIELEKISLVFNTAYPGTMSIAKIKDTQTTLISMYGKFLNYYRKDRDYVMDAKIVCLANLHCCLSDLYTHVIHTNQKLQPSFLIAGDWNTGPQFDIEGKVNRYSNFFDRLCGFGFKDCLGVLETKEYKETLVGSKKQIDWMFATKNLKVTNSVVDNAEEIKGLSDHYPIITQIKF